MLCALFEIILICNEARIWKKNCFFTSIFLMFMYKCLLVYSLMRTLTWRHFMSSKTAFFLTSTVVCIEFTTAISSTRWPSLIFDPVWEKTKLMGALLLSGNTAKLDGTNRGTTLSGNRSSLGSNAIKTGISGGKRGNNMTRNNHSPVGVKKSTSQIIPKNIFF